MSACPTVPAAPVRDWLDGQLVPHFGSLRAVARCVAGRYDAKPDSWYRFFIRLRRRSQISVYTLDRICTAVAVHVSAFDDYADILPTLDAYADAELF